MNGSGITVTRKSQGLLVEKCRFLETAGCAKTCLHACKIPTQRFFLEEMGLPVTLLPNMTDFRYCTVIYSVVYCIVWCGVASSCCAVVWRGVFVL